MNYGTMAPRDPELDMPPKYEECEELPPLYDEATMSPGVSDQEPWPRPPSYSQVCHLSFDNKGFHH